MKKILISLLIIGFGVNALAQSIVFEEEVMSHTSNNKVGPNRLHYLNFFMGYGWTVGESQPGSMINYGLSGEFQFGLRYKLRACNFYSLGLQTYFSASNFRLNQDEGKTLPDTISHDFQRMNISALGMGFYNRFNFGRRGDHVGNFLDLGVYGEWNYARSYFTKDKLSNDEVLRSTLSRLSWVEPISYGFYAQLGFNRYVIYGKYRYSDLFKESSGYNELPRYTVGIQIGFHR